MSKSEDLIQIAISQHGYFTATQAANCGYIRTNHHYQVKSGGWVREGRGIYRHSGVPLTAFSQYWYINLWSRNKQDEPQAVFSHETALNLYELSDANPSKIHITVPRSFRKSQVALKSLKITKSDLARSDIKSIEGLKVTTAPKTLTDIIEEQTLGDEIIEQALKEARSRGLITKAEIKANPDLARYAI